MIFLPMQQKKGKNFFCCTAEKVGEFYFAEWELQHKRADFFPPFVKRMKLP